MRILESDDPTEVLILQSYIERAAKFESKMMSDRQASQISNRVWGAVKKK